MDSNEVLYDLLKEFKVEQRKQTDDITNILINLASIQKDVARNTEDLATHMCRSDSIEQLVCNNKEYSDKQIQLLSEKLIDNNKRIEVLEEPSKVKAFLYHKYVKFAGIVSASLGVLYGIFKIFKII
jgi:hypothetical protein